MLGDTCTCRAKSYWWHLKKKKSQEPLRSVPELNYIGDGVSQN